MPRCVTSRTCYATSNLIFRRDIDRSNGKVTILDGDGLLSKLTRKLDRGDFLRDCGAGGESGDFFDLDGHRRADRDCEST